MEIEVRFYAQLRRLAGSRSKTLMMKPGSRVRDLFEKLLAEAPTLRPELVDETGQLYKYVRILVNGVDLMHLPQGWETPLAAGDQVSLFPAIAGG